MCGHCASHDDGGHVRPRWSRASPIRASLDYGFDGCRCPDTGLTAREALPWSASGAQQLAQGGERPSAQRSDRAVVSRSGPRTRAATMSGSPSGAPAPARAAWAPGRVCTSPCRPEASSHQDSHQSSGGNGGRWAFAFLQGGGSPIAASERRCRSGGQHVLISGTGSGGCLPPMRRSRGCSADGAVAHPFHQLTQAGTGATGRVLPRTAQITEMKAGQVREDGANRGPLWLQRVALLSYLR